MRLTLSRFLGCLMLAGWFSTPAASQETPAPLTHPTEITTGTTVSPAVTNPANGSNVVSPSTPKGIELAGPFREAWGQPMMTFAPVASTGNHAASDALRGFRERLDGFGWEDVGIGALNGVLWRMIFAEVFDAPGTIRGSLKGALGGIVTVTAIWTAFGPIY